MTAPAVVVTVTRPKLTAEERKVRIGEVKATIAEFYAAFAEKNGGERWDEFQRPNGS